MGKLRIKLIGWTLFLIVLLAIPDGSISQDSNQNPVDQRDSMTGTAAPATINMEALAKIREDAENQSDLTDTDKKNVLSLLDRAIALDQSEAQLRKAGVTISFPQRDVHLDQVGPLEAMAFAFSLARIHPIESTA